MFDLSRYLSGGDLRSIGKSNELVKLIGNDQNMFDEVFNGIYDEDKLVRSRAADALEKASQKFPELLESHKKEILKNLDGFAQNEVRWHIAMMLGYMDLKRRDLAVVVQKLQEWLFKETHKFIRVAYIQALADLAFKNRWLKNEVIGIIESEMERGSAAMKARGRILLKKFLSLKQ